MTISTKTTYIFNLPKETKPYLELKSNLQDQGTDFTEHSVTGYKSIVVEITEFIDL